ncbi:MAG: hypothetical protein ACRC6T_03200 [Sarcina sp.]
MVNFNFASGQYSSFVNIIRSYPTEKDSDLDGEIDFTDDYPLDQDFFEVVKELSDKPTHMDMDEQREASANDYGAASASEYGSVKLLWTLTKAATGSHVTALLQPNASEAMLHFLINVGTDHVIDMKNLLETEVAKAYLDENLKRAVKYAKNLLNDGETIYIRSKKALDGHGYNDSTGQIDASFDWHNCIGMASAGLVARVSRKGNHYYVDTDYTVYDFYDWEPKKEKIISNILPDSDLYELHHVGWAKEYYVSGDFRISKSYYMP